MTSKISRLPLEIRDQLNERLSDGQPAALVVTWLNALPEVKAVLHAQFDGQPISKQNLSDYKRREFRRWQIRRDALQFASENPADIPMADGSNANPADAETANAQTADPFSSTLIDRLVQWIATRFAAAAQTAPIPNDPRADLREIRSFIGDIVALRRGDLAARRIAVEQKRVELCQSRDDHELEILFWQWTKRPHIQAKLYPNRDPDKTCRDTVRFIDQHFLGVSQTEPEPDIDPACAI